MPCREQMGDGHEATAVVTDRRVVTLIDGIPGPEQAIVGGISETVGWALGRMTAEGVADMLVHR